MILVGHFGEVVADGLTVFEANGRCYGCPEDLEALGDGGVGGETSDDVDVFCQRGATVLVEDLGEAIKKREAQVGGVAGRE